MSPHCQLLGLVLSLCACACSASGEDHSLGVRREAVVYGSDDRLDVFEHPDPALRTLVARSIVALMPKDMITHTDQGPSFAMLQTAQEYGLCAGERFADQPIVATCSGVLLADDLVLTAAHCLAGAGGDGIACGDLVLAFDYFYASRGQLARLRPAAIYACRKVVVLEHSVTQVPRRDYAVIQLDRAVSADRAPITISQRDLVASDALVTISFPIGLPAKIDSSALVVDPRLDHGDYFSLMSDVFEGSSGGAVLDSEHKLVGILASGSNDFAAADAGCATPVVVAQGERALTWEHASYVGPAIDVLCSSRESAPPLCRGLPPSASGCSVTPVERSGIPALLVLACAFAATWRRRGKRAGTR
jgi:hypothetical protein